MYFSVIISYFLCDDFLGNRWRQGLYILNSKIKCRLNFTTRPSSDGELSNRKLYKYSYI